jgi:hypothetical protein
VEEGTSCVTLVVDLLARCIRDYRTDFSLALNGLWLSVILVAKQRHK